MDKNASNCLLYLDPIVSDVSSFFELQYAIPRRFGIPIKEQTLSCQKETLTIPLLHVVEPAR